MVPAAGWQKHWYTGGDAAVDCGSGSAAMVADNTLSPHSPPFEPMLPGVDRPGAPRHPLPQLVGVAGQAPPGAWNGSAYTPDWLGGDVDDPHLPADRQSLYVAALEALAPDFPGLKALSHMAQCGATLGFTGDRSRGLRGTNGPSTRTAEGRAFLADMCAREEAAGWIERVAPGDVAFSAPLHLIPKKHAPGAPLHKTMRLIYDATWGAERSLNFGIPLDPPVPAQKHTTTRDIREQVARYLRAGLVPWISLNDADAAYRRVATKDAALLGFSVVIDVVDAAGDARAAPAAPASPSHHPRGARPFSVKLQYRHLRLPFGVRSSSVMFCLVTDAIVWAARRRGMDARSTIDDIQLLHWDERQLALDAAWVSALMERVGLPVSAAKFKVSGTPARVQEVLGVTFDTERGVMYLSAARVDAFFELMRSAMCLKYLPYSLVAKLGGKCSWFTQVYDLAKPFARSFWRAAGSGRPGTFVRVTRQMHRDADFFMAAVRRLGAMPIVAPPVLPTHIYTDASLTGFGGAFGGDFFCGEWTPAEIAFAGGNIYVLEGMALVLAVMVFADSVASARVRCHIDNEAMEHVVRQWRSRHLGGSGVLQLLSRELLALGSSIDIVGVRSKANDVADDLSRGVLPSYFSFPHDRSQRWCGSSLRWCPTPARLRSLTWQGSTFCSGLSRTPPWPSPRALSEPAPPSLACGGGGGTPRASLTTSPPVSRLRAASLSSCSRVSRPISTAARATATTPYA